MDKDKILRESRQHVVSTCRVLEEKQQETKTKLENYKSKFKRSSEEDKIVESSVIKFEMKKVDELEYLKGSPYFVRCEVKLEDEPKVSSLYFGKFGSDTESIYSWVVPAAVIRFDAPGEVLYECPDGSIAHGMLLRKDQFMITDGEIKFLSSENLDEKRELIYQEYFSSRKSGFVLPEIVAEMEKSQDAVIRAHHIGPFLISGPAGSGKTTLALHRVAYLLQSPDLSETYTSDKIIVFVQDTGTKAYFSELLPQLGIDDVTITTFSDWAMQILGIDLNFTEHFGSTEEIHDLYESAKISALRQNRNHSFKNQNVFAYLGEIYKSFFTTDQNHLFDLQRENNNLDRIDLTLLLLGKMATDQNLQIIKDYYIEQKNGQYKKRTGPVPVKYSLAIVDEFQNYLPEQLQIFNTCMDSKLKSIIYVGDLAQQVRLGTIRQFSDINTSLLPERQVVLQKVYRNTANILKYIQSLGYNVSIPDKIASGSEVVEIAKINSETEIDIIKNALEKADYSSVGILAKDENYLTNFQADFENNKKIHLLSFSEAQGVEFDIVFMVGIRKDQFEINQDLPPELRGEKRKINRDLLYVALSRAIKELFVLGQDKLSDILK
ncbi:MAG: AAA family ATPase [Candidatus Berkelbacteria bacterium]|nr:AAA family ATPase [Candidatus Berkelbacteria bacterium]